MSVSKVLVVDDSATDLKHIQNIVSDAGYFVSTASSGAEAVSKAKGEKPDLIFLDIIMDEMDGYEVFRTLSKDETTSGIPVIFLTSKNQKADKKWAEIQGAKGFITKPATSEQISNEINKF